AQGGAHPAIWIVAGICVLASAAMALVNQLALAAVVLGAGVLAGVAGLIWQSTSRSRSALGQNRMLGKGPYTSTPCTPNHELAQKLAATLNELRDAANDGDWAINWGPLDDSCRQAQKAEEAGNFVEAVRHYCRAISFVMSELRAQNS